MQFEHNAKPPIYERCVEQFGADWDRGACFAYGDTAYSKDPLTPHKAIHEGIHLQQQKENGPEAWWDQYFIDPGFRLKQEKEAYLAESKFLKASMKNREQRFHIVERNARALSSELYGNLISYTDALKLLR